MTTSKRILMLMLDGHARRLGQIADDLNLTGAQVHNVMQHLRHMQCLDRGPEGYVISQAGRERAAHVPHYKRPEREQKDARNARLFAQREKRNAERRASRAEKRDEVEVRMQADPRIVESALRSRPVLQMIWGAGA